MKRSVSLLATSLILFNLSITPFATAETAEEIFNKGQAAYNNRNFTEALQDYLQAIQQDPNCLDAYFNAGAIYYNQEKFPEALDMFNQLLQRDPNDQAAHYQTGRIYEKMGKTEQAIKAFEAIKQTSSRFVAAQENIARLKLQMKRANTPQTQVSTTQPASSPAVSTEEKHSVEEKPPNSSTISLSKPETVASLPKTPPHVNKPDSSKPAIVEEYADGFFGPTGIAVDNSGVLYVANFSKNTIYSVSPTGEKKLLASGEGINGPVGLAIDNQTGDLYIANHLNNSIARISPDGKVSVVATGLKKPYNLFFDEAHRTLYVSQQETNSIAKIRLN
jgi:tetratricopeptide (TPR) repeat protein